MEEASSEPPAPPAGGDHLTGCQLCGAATYIQRVFDVFRERVCVACIRQTDDFRTVTKSAALSDFMLAESDLRSMRAELRPNPVNSKFRDMRLYLLKHVVRFVRSWSSCLVARSDLLVIAAHTVLCKVGRP